MYTASHPLISVAALGACLVTSPARAEMPTYAYVGIACSKNESRAFDAAILFTDRVAVTQDADTHEYTRVPAYPILPRGLDHGMSGGIVTTASPQSDEASCNSKQILVRHGASPLETDDRDEWISVWVNGRRILSKFSITYDTSASGVSQPADAGIVIAGGKVYACPHTAMTAKNCKLLGDTDSLGDTQAPYDDAKILPGRIQATYALDIVMEQGPDSDAHRLVVVLANPAGSFDLAAENSKVLSITHYQQFSSYPEPNGYHIRRGTFTIRMSKDGPGGFATITFTFRHQNGHFVLIGYDYRGEHVGWGQVSFNLLTGQIVTTEGPVEAGGLHSVESRKTAKFIPPAPIDLQTIEQGFAFDERFMRQFWGK